MNDSAKHTVHRHFDKAVELIRQYDGKETLHFYLKKYFANHKQHGARDRKTITHFCYAFFRIGNNLSGKSLEEKLKVALFLCEEANEQQRTIFPQDWLENYSSDLSKRIDFIQKIYPEFSLYSIFPYENELSKTIDTSAFQQSLLIQPKVFFRIRNGKKDMVLKKLTVAKISFETVSENCFSVAQNTRLNEVLQLDEEAVIQDFSSQKIEEFFKFIYPHHSSNPTKSPFKIWDCCAASGGKSILAKDIFGEINLTVSDIRPQILNNLHRRFREAKITGYQSFVADLSKPVSLSEKFDLIICDAPCTGSGTWSRTPERLATFGLQQITQFQSLQKKLVANCIPHLSEGGFFLYITCSVLEKENEEMATFIEENFSLRRIRQENILGYAQRADTMFAVLFSSEKQIS
jgi:16S rRNA (cytosine967-C5)-methyltransferase